MPMMDGRLWVTEHQRQAASDFEQCLADHGVELPRQQWRLKKSGIAQMRLLQL
jgi:hypothetical protein